MSFGYRELKGIMPPTEDPSTFRLYWKETKNGILFFCKKFIKEWKLWAPCQSSIKVVEGGKRIPDNQFDMGIHTFHVVERTGPEEYKLIISVDVADHCSIHSFSGQQLHSFTEELTETPLPFFGTD